MKPDDLVKNGSKAFKKEMFRDVIQQVMEVEMDEELGRERCQRAQEPEGTPRNYQNGYSEKTVKTQLGEIDIKIPRDRNGSFEPKIISKCDRNADGMEEKILSLYACGMSQRGIHASGAHTTLAAGTGAGKGIQSNRAINRIKFLILSKITYTKFSGLPPRIPEVPVIQ